MHGMNSRPRSSQVSTVRNEMKRLLLIFVGAVVVLDAAVIGLYYALRIEDRPIKQQQMFVGVWVALTLIVVMTMMRRIRVARRRRL